MLLLPRYINHFNMHALLKGKTHTHTHTNRDFAILTGVYQKFMRTASLREQLEVPIPLNLHKR